MPTTDSNEELLKKLCDIFNVFPEELQYGLDSSITKGKMRDLIELILADREAAVREAEKSQGNTSCPNCEQVIEYCDLCGSRLEPLNQPTKEGETDE